VLRDEEKASMIGIIHAVTAFAVKGRTIGARLWNSLREPWAPLALRRGDRQLARARSRTHANFAIFR
jgi:hypothetical protein